jgi:hypothetical protein
VPFLGTPMYFADVNETGLPYVMREVGFYRQLNEPSKWLTLSPSSTMTADIQLDVGSAFVIFAAIAQSLGIAPSLSVGLGEADSDPNVEPLTAMFADLVSRSFSFSSQENHRR